MSEDEKGSDATHYLAERLTTHASAAEIQTLTGDRTKTRLTSEEAHRLAAHTARETEKRQKR